MKFGLQKSFALVSVIPLAVVFNACGDDSSTSGSSDGGNRGGIPDTVETFMELSDYDCGKSQKCVATYLTEYHDMAVCDGDNGWVIGTLIEKMDCDFSSSSAKSSDSKSNDPAEVTDDSSDSKDNPSSAGTSTKSSASKEPDSSGSEGVEGSSASVPGGSSDASVYDVVTGTLTDSRDGQTYRTVKIGDKVWMAENLNYAYTGVPYKYGSYTSDSTSWCYDNAPANCAKYGRLYTWAAAMDSVGEWSTNGKGCGYLKTCLPIYPVRGVCPEGWHLPTQSEWNTLFTAVGGSSVAGTKLKSTSGWNSSGNGTDAFSFSALPAGLRNLSGNYDNEGNYAYFWSSTEHYSNTAYRMYLNYDDANLDVSNRNRGLSVRCVKDSD